MKLNMTPESLVQASSLYGQIDEQQLLSLAYTLLDQNPQATPDDFDYYCCQAIGDR